MNTNDTEQPEKSSRKGTLRASKEQQQRAARLLQQSEREKPNRKGPSRLRILIWVVELTILLAVAEHYLVRPLLRKASPELPAATTPPSPLRGPKTEPLGERARKLHGLHEVVPTFLAHLEGLAEGSRSAQQTQQMVSAKQNLPLEVENTVGMRFRLIPDGTSLMGSAVEEKKRWEGEEQHVAMIRHPFYFGKHEVTQAQWQTVMGSNPSYFHGPDRPVEEVTWYDCQKFCIALCKMENVPLNTYRLPTESEWEYACRAGTTTAYYFGDDRARLGDYAEYAGNNDHATSPVGQRLPNAYGLYNMHGNVWEWCLNLFKLYDGSDPDDLSKGEWRVLRGGNWHDPAENCRSANRCRLPPASHGNLLGLRVVRAIAGEKSPLPAPGISLPPPVTPKSAESENEEKQGDAPAAEKEKP